jgi:ribonuclease P protein component
MTDATFQPAHRLHSNRDYGRVFHRQQKAAGRHVVVLVMPRPRKGAQEGRLGVMIGAKAVKTAVRRHQLKRWLRELFRTRLKTVLAAHDCIVLFRSDPPEDCHAQLDVEVAGLVAKALATQAQPGQRGGRRK